MTGDDRRKLDQLVATKEGLFALGTAAAFQAWADPQKLALNSNTVAKTTKDLTRSH